MNIDTGHLVSVPTDISKAELRNLLGSGYQPVPAELQPAAVKKLAGKVEAYVSPSSGGKLSKWAAAQRKKAAGKLADRKSKITKQSRKRNRGA